MKLLPVHSLNPKSYPKPSNSSKAIIVINGADQNRGLKKMKIHHDFVMGSRSITFGQAISVLHNVLTSFSESQRSRQIKVSFF